MAKKVLLITQWFDPEPTFKGLAFARELVRQGFEVEVLTGFPNYPEGKIYPGYRMKWLGRECVDGVSITRVPLYPNHDQSAVKRGLNYVSFAASVLCYGLFGARRPDVIYAYHPPLTVGIAAVLIRFFRNVPVVYDIQDMWPDSLRATGMLANPGALSLISKVCDWVYRRVDHIVVLSPGFKRLLVERGVPETKVDVIYNWCDENALATSRASVPAKMRTDDTFSILFAGNMGKAQALDSVLDAAKLVGNDFPLIRFVFIGGGVEVTRLKLVATKCALKNVSFLPGVPMADIGKILAEADALLVHLKNDPLFSVTIPSKTQAYMAVGKPLLMAVAGNAADVIRQAGCGLVAEPENAESIAASAIKLFEQDESMREQMGEKGRAYYERNFSLEVGVRAFGHIFNRLSAR
ncbi:MAG: glycosyltransferase family 4 protein [Gallionella sp.]|nr:glycosyltransferase family 4 protein [Gallionella sp.]